MLSITHADDRPRTNVPDFQPGTNAAPSIERHISREFRDQDPTVLPDRRVPVTIVTAGAARAFRSNYAGLRKPFSQSGSLLAPWFSKAPPALRGRRGTARHGTAPRQRRSRGSASRSPRPFNQD